MHGSPKPRDPVDWLGRKVQVRSGAGDFVMADGEIVGYCESPTIVVRAADGSRTNWSTSLPMTFTEDPHVELANFLLARIAEDEGRAQGHDGHHCETCAHDGYDAARVLAECAAKRDIVTFATAMIREAHTNPHGELAASDTVGEGLLRMVAQVYARHPDYREEWRP